jgi:hypothetical protein
MTLLISMRLTDTEQSAANSAAAIGEKRTRLPPGRLLMLEASVTCRSGIELGMVQEVA